MERELVFGSRSFKAPDGRVVKKSSIAQLARLSCPTEILEGEGVWRPRMTGSRHRAEFAQDSHE